MAKHGLPFATPGSLVGVGKTILVAVASGVFVAGTSVGVSIANSVKRASTVEAAWVEIAAASGVGLDVQELISENTIRNVIDLSLFIFVIILPFEH